MKRLLIMLLLIFPAYMLGAFTDSFSATSSDPAYMALIDAVKNGEDEDTVEALYGEYMATEPSMVERSRIEYHMARYFKDMGNDGKAESHVEKEKEYFSLIGDDASDLESRVAEADMVSADYYVNGGMGKGMESSDLTKSLYRDYPDEYYVALQEGFRLLYTPPIAGGSAKKALNIFNAVEKEMGGLSKLDLFSFYTGKGMALSERDEYDESDRYLDKAEEIYKSDPAIEDARRENNRGRRNNRNR